MANYLTNTTDLTAVADAIREKTGESGGLIYPSGFVSAIEGISGGLGTKSVSIYSINDIAPSYIYYVDENMVAHENTDTYIENVLVPIGTLIYCYGSAGPGMYSGTYVYGVTPIHVEASIKSLIAIYQVI